MLFIIFNDLNVELYIWVICSLEKTSRLHTLPWYWQYVYLNSIIVCSRMISQSRDRLHRILEYTQSCVYKLQCVRSICFWLQFLSITIMENFCVIVGNICYRISGMSFYRLPVVISRQGEAKLVLENFKVSPRKKHFSLVSCMDLKEANYKYTRTCSEHLRSSDVPVTTK